MPIYEYRCQKCGSYFEVIQKFSDRPLKTCSSCKGRLTKLISQTSFQLKGEGWYVTDYAKKSKPSAKADDSSKKPEDSPKTGGDSAAKSDSATQSDSASKGESASKGDSASKSESTSKTESGKSSDTSTRSKK